MKNLINQFLSQYGKQLAPTRLGEATQYALEAGGKRLRPLIVLSLIQSYGMDYVPYVPLACALEMIHIYSLIHDDLPAMDDDDLRHGKPTIHKAFDEATAILVGDGLLTNAFGVIAQQAILTDAQKIKLITILSEGAGLTGMVYGQHLDMASEGKKLHLRALEEISLHKTGKLLEAAFLFGSIIGSPKDQSVWSNIGLNLGLMFQIQDDVLEVTVSEEQLKKSKSDLLLEKATFVSQLGLQQAKDMIEQLYQQVKVTLSKIQLKNQLITELINKIYDRRY
jgi:geranylgeranyl diphosphate synthase type II